MDFYKIKEWVTWSLVRAHLCTLGVAVGLHATWRSPRDAFRHGGLQYGLALTVAMLLVALPLALLQLAVGQLSQQDAVGVWRAVPFFRGVGYLKLLISFLAAIYTVIYTSLTITYFLYTISNSLPFWDCLDLLFSENDSGNSVNASACLNKTFMAPIAEKPEYYLNVAFILLFLWIIFPFIFYNPVKLMKRIIYVSGPAVVILTIFTASWIGSSANLSTLVKGSDWRGLIEPKIWHAALVQALLSTQIAGGYLISVGDTLYSNTNVQWTAVGFVGANILSSWVGLLFWYSISGTEKDTSVFAVLIHAYQVGEDVNVDPTWPLIIFFILILSGFITLLTLLFPIYDHCRRIAGLRWRVVSVAGSLVGAGLSVGALAVRAPALVLLDDYAVPLLVSLTIVLEVLAFVFIYGWKVLVEDVEFLTGRKLGKCWVLGWCAAPGVIAPVTVWWVTTVYRRGGDWLEPPWPAITIIVSAGVAVIVLLVLASIVIVRQVQYDLVGKLKSSFRPSRHWGPRDPITHYYWLARREELESGNTRSIRYHRHQVGQLSTRPSFFNLTYAIQDQPPPKIDRKRANSDDLIFTVFRKQMQAFGEQAKERGRAKSLDWTHPNPRIEDLASYKRASFSAIYAECMPVGNSFKAS